MSAQEPFVDHALLILVGLALTLGAYIGAEALHAADVKFLEGLALLLAGALAGVAKPGGG